MGPLFHDLAERLNAQVADLHPQRHVRRSARTLAGFKHLRHKQHEVILWHILDGAELTFPFQEATLFRGLEAVSRIC